MEIARTYGMRGLVRRAAHELRLRAHAYRRIVPAEPTAATAPLRLDLAAVRRWYAQHPDVVAAIRAAADRLLAGEYPFFGAIHLPVGWPPPWATHARTGESLDSRAHWTELATDLSRAGDVKWIWEPSRLAFTWLLARALVATGERRYGAELVRGIRSWGDAHPPFCGAPWACGQETALRAIALVFASSVLREFGALENEDRGRIDRLLHASGVRIAAALGHALSQRNNHAISEAVGLWTLSVVGAAWPEAAGWRAASVRAIAEAVRDQFAVDGAYIQESINYHRLAIHLLLWAEHVARTGGIPAPVPLEHTFQRSFDLLTGLMPAEGGAAPNYGHNDGALLHALSVCPFEDMRPLLQHLAATIDAPTPFPPGAWDEERTWFGRAGRPHVPPAVRALRVTASGYLSARRGDWFAFTRVPRHAHHRPAHADALHLDVWNGARNIALDPGTFAYSEPAPWDNRLAETRYHNTCSVGERSQMRRRGRFLWTHWTRADLIRVIERDDLVAWLARTPAEWRSEFEHWRMVMLRPSRLDVIDRIEGPRRDVLRLHWNLDGVDWHTNDRVWTDGEFAVRVASSTGATIRVWRGEHNQPAGWSSRTYGHRVPCTGIELEVQARAAWFHTSFTAGSEPPPPALEAWTIRSPVEAFESLVVCQVVRCSPPGG